MRQSSSNTRQNKWLAAILFVIALNCGVAQAHVRSESISRWQFDDGTLTVSFTIAAREATRIPQRSSDPLPLNVAVARYLADRIIIHGRRDGCRATHAFTPVRSRPGVVQVEAEWRCDTLPESVEIRAFFDLASEHVHFATFRTADDLSQHLFTEANPVWRLRQTGSERPAPENSSTSFGAYIALGMTHISTGYDHVAFLLALLLICRNPRDVLFAVSGFTIGHSMTLALGVLGMVRPDTSAIEATIGLTIALVAVQQGSLKHGSALGLASLIGLMLLAMAVLALNEVGQLSVAVHFGLALFSFCYILLNQDSHGHQSRRVLMTVLFGLVHGLGFAGAFIETELPPELLGMLLLGFNIGVEIGQLVLVGLMLVMISLLRRLYRPRTLLHLNDFTAAGLCGLGVFLFVHRSFGPVLAG